MMSSLSPEELQALLTGQQRRRAGRRRLHFNAVTRPYSLQTSLTLTPRQRAMMRQWAEQAAYSLRYTLISNLRLAVEVRLQSDGLVSLPDLVKGWQGNTFIATLATLGNLGGEHCLALSSALVMVALDRLLGGPGIPLAVQRPLSRLEISLLTKFMESLGRAFVSVLGGESIDSIPVRVANLTNTTEQLSLLTDQHNAYAFCYELRLGNETGQLWFSLRADALKGLEQPNKQKQPPSPDRLYQHPAGALPLTLRVRLGTGRMSLRELRQLQVGDVIVLEAFKGTPVQICFSERVLCLARPGTKDGQFAVQILPSQRGGTE